jgi:hypothetical protein
MDCCVAAGMTKRGSDGDEEEEATWSCTQCTFENNRSSKCCEMCEQDKPEIKKSGVRHGRSSPGVHLPQFIEDPL